MKEQNRRSVSFRERGLTLLEVLIAIVVLVLAVSTILPLFAVGSASHKRGIDQAQMAWLAPRVAALLQDRMADAPPDVVHGYVREMEDGSLLIDDGATSGKLKDDGGAAYRFTATFTLATTNGVKDVLGPVCYLLKVELGTKEGGEDRIESYETIVLRKLAR